MRQNCKNRIIDLIKTIKNLEVNRKCTEAMMIVDETTGPILNSIIHYFKHLGVKNITKISLKKKVETNCIGVYYVTPSSLKQIAQDFGKEATYHSINILCSGVASQQQMKEIAAENKIIERLAFFGELQLTINYVDRNFGMICEQMPLLKTILTNPQKKLPQEMKCSEIASKILQSIICGYGRNFIIKAYYQNTPYIEQIVKHLTQAYRKMQQEQVNNKQNTEDQYKINLLLVDRKIDLISPLVRNFYYVTMLSELMHIDYNHKDVTLKEGKTVKLNFDDPIFNQYRNQHISKVQSGIEQDFKKFKAENKALQHKEKNLQNVSLKHIIRDIPEYNRKIVSYEEQISMMHDINSISKEQGIPEIGEIEQLIVTGFGGHGQQIKDKIIYQRALQLCNKHQNNQEVVVKILLLVLFCLSISQSEKKSIISRVKQQPGYTDLASILQSKLAILFPKPIKLKPKFKKEKVFLDIHESLITTIITQLIENGTSKLVNMFVIGEQKKLVSKFEAITTKVKKQWLVCMLGGISINQICQLQRIQQSFDSISINILSNSIFTTWSFVTELNKIF